MPQLARCLALLTVGSFACAAPPPATPAKPAPVSAEEPVDAAPPQTTSAAAELFFARLEADDFDGAAGRFHYRATGPTHAQRQRQRDEIAHFLFAVTTEMGRITARRTAGAAGEVLFGSIGSGTVDYWQPYGDPVTLTFEVEVETDGSAYVQLGFSFVDGDAALRTVGYGLPSARPGAAERLSDIMERAFDAPQPE